ncbi:Beta-barrel assembly machine subunit BamD [Tenacibaculum sp. MAR_2009_124]|uniref:outer membrane protein assembly factor BamD n=1 Tax=Tenacibaculum sp. MAR_2009_124 TaxID=1250059 RepID=UPI00089899E5|nr:outer membrane protein assembly factor BamD [Tenacibaculum sp. MAR_2009_124]SEB53579.1 Beta-barrel assembly machine subunit BamD [Tenacibaculum sp. MAR_2009_124]
MRKNKNLALLFILMLVFTSCGEYQKVLNKGTTEEQYKMAVKMYESQKYSKALRLFEKITPSYRAKPQMERIQFMVSQANFNVKNYSLAGYYFDRFAKNYPKSSKAEEAEFLSALSYYKAAPAFSLDPTDTNKALDAFQRFIDKYPDSGKLVEANKYYGELRLKLEEKAFEIAKTYYRTARYDSRNYRAAIVAFDNLLSEYLGTSFKEEALYYRLKAAHDFAIKSTPRRKLVRIEEAVKAYNKLKRNFPESKFLGDSDKMLAALHKEQEQLVKS